MLFHTWVFLVFCLIVFPVYLLVRKHNQLMNIWFLIASYTFYGPETSDWQWRESELPAPNGGALAPHGGNCAYDQRPGRRQKQHDEEKVENRHARQYIANYFSV